MEIRLKDLVCSSVNEEKRLNNVNVTFSNATITFCSGLSGRLLRDLLIGKKQKLSGAIESSEKMNPKDIGYVGNNALKEFKTKKVLEEAEYRNQIYNLEYQDIRTRMKNALLMVGLEESYFSRTFISLSTSELKKIEFALMLFLNPKVIIVDYYEKGLNYKDIDYFKKIVKKLATKYQKNIILFSDDMTPFLDLFDCYVIFDKGHIVVTGSKNDIYNEDIYKYIKCPNIIDFVKKARDYNVELLNYIDIKELIKAIYRDVEKNENKNKSKL